MFSQEDIKVFLKVIHKELKKVLYIFCNIFCIHLVIFYEPLHPRFWFFYFIQSLIFLTLWRSCFVSLPFTFRIEHFFQFWPRNDGTLALKIAGSEKNCNQSFFLENVYKVLLSKNTQFPPPTPLAFSPSMDLIPPKFFLACISLNIGPCTKMLIFNINLHQKV